MSSLHCKVTQDSLRLPIFSLSSQTENICSTSVHGAALTLRKGHGSFKDRCFTDFGAEKGEKFSALIDNNGSTLLNDASPPGHFQAFLARLAFSGHTERPGKQPAGSAPFASQVPLPGEYSSKARMEKRFIRMSSQPSRPSFRGPLLSSVYSILAQPSAPFFAPYSPSGLPSLSNCIRKFAGHKGKALHELPGGP